MTIKHVGPEDLTRVIEDLSLKGFEKFSITQEEGNEIYFTVTGLNPAVSEETEEDDVNQPLSISIQKQSVQAGVRRLGTTWSMILDDDTEFVREMDKHIIECIDNIYKGV